MRDHWSEIAIGEVGSPVDSHVDEDITIEVEISLGAIAPTDVLVLLAVGEVDIDGVLSATRTSTMAPIEPEPVGDGRYRYSCSVTCDHPGTMGFEIRVLPHHESLRDWSELALIRHLD